MLSKSLRFACRGALPLVCVLAIAWCGVAARAQGSAAKVEILTNAEVIKLVRARFTDKTVLSIIGSRPTRFDLSPDGLIALKRGGVSEKVIRAMLQVGTTQGVMSDDLAGDGWDDSDFGGDIFGKSRDGAEQRRTEPGEVDIFGSSGGSRGRSRTRGLDGTNDNDTQTTGSASVRIIRPPTEAGAVPKLEKTPTLTNDSVIELVAAGFSEGTILRRIEQSPVEFDLSAAKIVELKRRRVGERVIEAMRAAMSDSGSDNPSATQGR